MYITRQVEATILKAAASFPCIVVYGPRQVGKSTTVEQLFGEKYPCVSLDDGESRALALSNPKLFLEHYGWPLVIDEIQKAPCLLDEIKLRIDAQRSIWLKSGEERRLMYVLTGSNRYELQQGICDSLAGRCGVIEMSSLSQAELEGRIVGAFAPYLTELKARAEQTPYRTTQEIFARIYQGSMPDVCTGRAERELYYRSYVDTYLERDVRQLINVGNETAFRTFLALVALRTAQELRYEELARNAGVDVRTCKRWLAILATSGLVYLLQPYLPNISKRYIKAPKVYFMDTGLCAHLCKWPNAEMLAKCAMAGAFLETYVVSEIVKSYFGAGLDPRDYYYYYRDSDQREVDLIYADATHLYPLEIKKSVSPMRATRHFAALDRFALPRATGYVVASCEKILPIDEENYYLPVSVF